MIRDDAATTTKTTQDFTVRLPIEEHQALRLFCTTTGRSMNDVLVSALRDYLADTGRKAEFAANLTRLQEEYRVALDKLAQ